MLKLVRMALTAAILTAIAVRLRRRAHRTETEPEPTGPEPLQGRSTRADLARYAGRGRSRPVVALFGVGALIAVVFGVFVLMGMPIHDREEDPLGEMFRDSGRQPAMTAGPEPTPDYVSWTPPPVVPDPACHPERRPVTVRPLDPQVRRAVDRQWRRIERWLKAKAPRTYATLGRPGRARTIAVAESQMGIDFPDSLRASLLRHNGAKGFGPGYGSQLSTRQIRDAWRQMCQEDPTNLGPEPGAEFSGVLIPFQDRYDEGYGLIDSETGSLSWDVAQEGMLSTSDLPSYDALLRATADALEQGGTVDGTRPRVVRGTLRWERAG
ncbi:SMI1/KNR4 family protein [Nonomuraea guangzhouensis]|uniref:SMI1/KNR4 family protein n=1 Tax=Nonomuraea guangzhouensis TaxID=1291555 RepID=A0ABW4FZW2_9ACTN|nr:SMI1/KNR4 family protein [Nonomuraea guangzhouensis]